MPDALSTIEQFESGGRNIQQQVVPSSVSTASGYYQITNSTWNGSIAPYTGLPTVGPGTSNPDGVMDLSAAQQQTGAAYLYQTQGFGPWTCSGCNSALANYIAANGGAGAFTLSTPLANGNIDPSGLGITATDPLGNITLGGSNGTTSINVGPLGCGYTSFWTQFTTTTQATILNEITNFQGMIAGGIGGLIALGIIAAIVRGHMGKATANDVVAFLIKAGLILALVSVGSIYYSRYVITPVQQAPTWWLTYLVGSGYPANSPTAMMCWVDSQTYAVSVATTKGLSWYDVSGIGWILAARFLITVSLWWALNLKAAMTIIEGIALIVGPIILPTGLFQKTEGMLWGWTGIIGTGLLSLLGIDLITSIYGAIMIAEMQNLTATDRSLWGMAGIVFSFGAAVTMVPVIWLKLGGGVAVGTGALRQFMGGAIVAETALGGAAVATAAAGGGAVGAAAYRLTSAVGSTLSREI